MAHPAVNQILSTNIGAKTINRETKTAPQHVRLTIKSDMQQQQQLNSSAVSYDVYLQEVPSEQILVNNVSSSFGKKITLQHTHTKLQLTSPRSSIVSLVQGSGNASTTQKTLYPLSINPSTSIAKPKCEINSGLSFVEFKFQ
jgi:hypothetical protein